MKTISHLKNENEERFEDLGKIIASLIEIMVTNMAVDINMDGQCIHWDNFAFATFNDGMIYQFIPLYCKEGEKNNFNQITYRRK